MLTQMWPVLAASLLIAPLGSAQEEPAKAAEDKARLEALKALYVSVAELETAPAERRQELLEAAYEKAYPEAVKIKWHCAWHPSFQTLSPKERAEKLAELGVGYLTHDMERQCEEQFKTHGGLLVPRLKKDLAGARLQLTRADQDKLQLAIQVAGMTRQAALWEDLVKVFKEQPGLRSQAAYALRDLGDTRSIPLLAADGKEFEWFELLRTLSRKRPAAPEVRALLRSDSETVRWRAAYALAESGDPILAAELPALFQAGSTMVRQHAVALAFSMPEKEFQALRPKLVELLEDKEPSVRREAVRHFVWRKDPACGAALLDLARATAKEARWDRGVNEWVFIVNDIKSLCDTDFGLYKQEGTNTLPPEDEAWAKFEAWVKEANAKK